MASIALSRGLFAIIDDEDFALVSAHKWFAKPAYSSLERFYAARTVRRLGMIYLHRVIMDAPPGVMVDHINGDGLDNRRANLRLADPSQNVINRRYANEWGYRGVSQSEAGYTTWRAVLRHGRSTYRVCGLSTPEEAARAYDRMAKEHHGEFAVLNFPEGTQ